jgi:hypothetical protein
MKILKTSIIILACNFLCIFLQLAWSINEKEAYHTLGQNSVSMPTHYVKAKKVKTYVVTKQWNVIADGQTMNTVALQKAIDEVSLQGGGKILFPEGQYLTGALLLKSNVELNLDSGAVILGSINPKDYYTTGSKNYKNVEDKQLALIMASDVSGITLTGKGTIDGQGRALALAVDSLHLIGEVIDPEYNVNSSRPNENMRPKLFSMFRCKKVTISGLHLKNSACWGLSFDRCEDLSIAGVTIFNRAFWNNDGIDVSDSHRVFIQNCKVNSADDGICLKSHETGVTDDSIRVENCEIRSSASAIKFGTASWGGFTNIRINNIKVFDTYRSAIAIESVDGGKIENVDVSNIIAKNTSNAIFIRLGHRAGDNVGSLRNVRISNMKVEIPFGRPDTEYDMRGPDVGYSHNSFPSSITGIPGYNVENVILENIEIVCPGRASKGMAYMPLWRLKDIPENINRYPEYDMFRELPSWGFFLRHVTGVKMKNIRLKLENEDFRPAIVMDDVGQVNMEQMDFPKDKQVQVVTKDSKNIRVEGAIVEEMK